MIKSKINKCVCCGKETNKIGDYNHYCCGSDDCVRMVYVHEMKLYRDKLREHNNKK